MQEIYDKVLTAETIDELKQAILFASDSSGLIPGRTRMFNAEKMVEGLDHFMNGLLPANVLTRNYGIRQQAIYLKEQIRLEEEYKNIVMAEGMSDEELQYLASEELSFDLISIASDIQKVESAGGYLNVNDAGFISSLKIVTSIVVERMWQLQDKENIDMEIRLDMANKFGEELKHIIKKYSDIDTMEIVNKINQEYATNNS